MRFFLLSGAEKIAFEKFKKKDINQIFIACDRHWLSHETKFFLRACQLAYERNDFGLCGNTLAIVDSD